MAHNLEFARWYTQWESLLEKAAAGDRGGPVESGVRRAAYGLAVVLNACEIGQVCVDDGYERYQRVLRQIRLAQQRELHRQRIELLIVISAGLATGFSIYLLTILLA